MAYIGELPHFEDQNGDWQVFHERLDQFFEINDVPDEKKRAILITSIGDNIYKTLRDVCHPQLPKDKTFEELCALLEKQFVIKTSVYRERYNFYNAKQLPNESIANWFARLKKLSVDCKFGDRFDNILLDRFITGLRQSAILDRLCEEDEDKLTLQHAVDVAVTKESSVKDSVDDLDSDVETEPKKGRNRNRRGRYNRNE